MFTEAKVIKRFTNLFHRATYTFLCTRPKLVWFKETKCQCLAFSDGKTQLAVFAADFSLRIGELAAHECG